MPQNQVTFSEEGAAGIKPYALNNFPLVASFV